MITKEEFNSVWKDTTREGILNQFYYEHIDLMKLQQENKQLKGKLKTAEHNKEQSQLQCRTYRNKRKTLNHRIKRREQQRDRYKSVLDEMREYLETKDLMNIITREDGQYVSVEKSTNELLQILDKVGSNEQRDMERY